MKFNLRTIRKIAIYCSKWYFNFFINSKSILLYMIFETFRKITYINEIKCKWKLNKQKSQSYSELQVLSPDTISHVSSSKNGWVRSVISDITLPKQTSQSHLSSWFVSLQWPAFLYLILADWVHKIIAFKSLVAFFISYKNYILRCVVPRVLGISNASSYPSLLSFES